MRDEYGKELLKSLEGINTTSTKLMGEATKSHIHQAHLCTPLRNRWIIDETH